MFRRAPRRHRRAFPLAFQPLEPRLPMAGDFSFAFESGKVAIKADDAKYAEVAAFATGPALDSLGDLSKAPFLDAAGKDVAHLVDLHDRMQDMEAVKQAEQAGLSRDIERESKVVDPATGDPLEVGPGGKYTGLDHGMAGGHGADLLGKGRTSRLTDPLTGQPLFGGDGGATGPSQDDAMAAGRAGKGRARDDGDGSDASNVVTDNTVVATSLTFKQATDLAATDEGFSWTTKDGTVRQIHAGKTDDGVQWVWLTDTRPGEKPVHVIYYKGGSVTGEIFQKPRPDDDSGTPPRKLTDADKEAIRKELRGSFGPAGQPRPDDDGGSAGGYQGAGAVFTYLDLAGQPRPDDEAPYGGVAPNGPIMTGLGLAGQPVDDDPNFGVITPKFGGQVPANPVFGGDPPRP